MPRNKQPTIDAAGLAQLKADLKAQYGVMLGPQELRQVLGYRTASAFEKALKLGRIGVPLFNVPGRRGKFALTDEVATWLWQARQDTTVPFGGAP